MKNKKNIFILIISIVLLFIIYLYSTKIFISEQKQNKIILNNQEKEIENHIKENIKKENNKRKKNIENKINLFLSQWKLDLDNYSYINSFKELISEDKINLVNEKLFKQKPIIKTIELSQIKKYSDLYYSFNVKIYFDNIYNLWPIKINNFYTINNEWRKDIFKIKDLEYNNMIYKTNIKEWYIDLNFFSKNKDLLWKIKYNLNNFVLNITTSYIWKKYSFLLYYTKH